MLHRYPVTVHHPYTWVAKGPKLGNFGRVSNTACVYSEAFLGEKAIFLSFISWSESQDGASGLCLQRLQWIYNVSPTHSNLLRVTQMLPARISLLLEPLPGRGGFN